MDPVRAHCQIPGTCHKVAGCALYKECKEKGQCFYETLTAPFTRSYAHTVIKNDLGHAIAADLDARILEEK